MSKLAPIVIALLAAICVGEGIALWRMDARLTELELTGTGDVAARRSDRPPEDPGGGQATAAAQEEKTRSFEARVAVLERHREMVLERIPALAEAGGPVAADVAPPGTHREAIEKRLERLEQVAEKVDGRGKGGEEKEKPSITELSKLVEMTETQEDASVRTIDDGKKRTMDLLDLPRGDGTSMLDDLVAAVKDEEDPGAAMQKWFQRLMSETIPGRRDTYLTEIMRIQKSTWDGLSSVLSERQVTKLRRAGVDILEVKTGYEPFEELLTDR